MSSQKLFPGKIALCGFVYSSPNTVSVTLVWIILIQIYISSNIRNIKCENVKYLKIIPFAWIVNCCLYSLETPLTVLRKMYLVMLSERRKLFLCLSRLLNFCSCEYELSWHFANRKEFSIVSAHMLMTIRCIWGWSHLFKSNNIMYMRVRVRVQARAPV